jgi:DNA-binding NtrC family response regulator
VGECDELLARAARSQATVLLRGESGTGKEVAARLVHERSRQRSGPFLAVNVAALPDTLLESELFGHEKGAFTGAVTRKAGRVELAAGGTLLLDELGDLPPTLQPKLLRLLQEREYERVGGTQVHKTDVRFIAATHRDLEAMVAAGQFRQDLLFRVNVLQIRIPPLRERREDIPVLCERFAAALGAQSGRRGLRFDTAALARLASLDWPGNVRELRNFVERLVVMADEDLLTAALVERELGRLHRPVWGGSPLTAPPAMAMVGGQLPLETQRRDTEKAAILDALRRTGDNRSQAARVLGIGRRTLYSKLRELGLE